MRTYDKEKAREKRVKKAAAEGRIFVEKTPTGIVANSKSDYRREYKRLLRRNAGKVIRSTEDTRKKREVEAQKKKERLQKKQLCDSHVKRFIQVMRDRKKYALRYLNDPEKEKARASRRKQLLPDSYIKQQLKSFGIPVNAITPELVTLKRQAMDARRISKTIKRAIKNHWKEENETITKHT